LIAKFRLGEDKGLVEAGEVKLVTDTFDNFTDCLERKLIRTIWPKDVGNLVVVDSVSGVFEEQKKELIFTGGEKGNGLLVE